MNQEQIWTAVQEELRFQLAKPSYETWLKSATLISAEGSNFRIGVPSKLAKDWLEDRFAGLIQETLVQQRWSVGRDGWMDGGFGRPRPASGVRL